MKNKILLCCLVLMMGFAWMGCDNNVNVSQEGNKVFINLKPDYVFNYAVKTASYFGLKVLSKDDAQRQISTQVTSGSNMVQYGAAQIDLSVTAQGDNAVINVKASINGNYDEQKSNQAAGEIVRRIVAYLNTFGSGLAK